jgi:hypothetical protein
MSEPRNVAVSRPPLEPDLYRPLSGLAVAAFIIAVLYAVLIGVVAIVALTRGTPLFMAWWTLLVPVVGGALAYAARQQIRRSDNIRSGLALTTWALWLCLAFGLGYLAYYMGTRTAVSLQAKSFSQQWLQKLQSGKINEAFLDTLEPLQRKNDRPNDPDYMYLRYGQSVGRRKGHLLAFKELDVVRLVEEWGKEAELTPLGVKDWEYEKGGFLVTQSCRLRTPEAETTFDLVVKSSEGPDIEGRQWHVLRDRLLLTAQSRRTELGQTLDQWRQQAHQFAAEWLRKRQSGEGAGAFLETLSPPDRTRRQAEQIGLTLLGVFSSRPGGNLDSAAGLLPVDVRVRLIWPEYRDYLAAKMIQTEGFMAVPRIRADILADVVKEFARPEGSVVRLADRKPQVRVKDMAQGPVEVHAPVDWAIMPAKPALGGMPKYTIEAALVLESDRGPISATRQPQWRVKGLQVLRGIAPSADPDSRLQ